MVPGPGPGSDVESTRAPRKSGSGHGPDSSGGLTLSSRHPGPMTIGEVTQDVSENHVEPGLRTEGGDLVPGPGPGSDVESTLAPRNSGSGHGPDSSGGLTLSSRHPGPMMIGEVTQPEPSLEDWIESLVAQSRSVVQPKDEIAVLPEDVVLCADPSGGTAHRVRDCVLDEDEGDPTSGPGASLVDTAEVQESKEDSIVKMCLVDLLRDKLLSKEEELECLDKDHKALLDDAMKFNKEWTRKKSETDRLSSLGVGDGMDPGKDDPDEVIVCGDIILTEDERSVLSLGPKFMVVSKLIREDMLIEENATMTKVRWHRRKDGVEGLTGRQEDLEAAETSEEETMAREKDEAEMRDVLSTDGCHLDMRRKRATDMRGNRSVMMPGPEKPIVEAEHSTRMDVWDKTFAKYMAAHCKESGEQVESNLSRGQALGLKSLLRKVSKLEIIILEADKGGKFVVVDEETFIAMANDHVKGDIPVSKEEVRQNQYILSSLSKAIANILCLGVSQSQRNYGRCYDNSGSKAEDVPNMKILAKVHKPPGPGGHLQSRPVVTAASCLSSRAGDQLSDLLEPLISVKSPRLEDLSTEEVLAQLKEAQDTVKEAGLKDVMVGSLDVKALYPSLDQEGSARAVAQFVRESEVELDGIDWRHVQVFLASHMDVHELKKEKVMHLVPARRKKGGCRPGIVTKELWVRKEDPDNKDSTSFPTKWAQTDVTALSMDDKKLLMSLVVMVSTRLIFRASRLQVWWECFPSSQGRPHWPQIYVHCSSYRHGHVDVTLPGSTGVSWGPSPGSDEIRG